MEMELSVKIAMGLAKTHTLWRRSVVYRQTEAGIDEETIMHGRILSMIRWAEEQGKPFYQKDIERETGLNKSTVSMILKKLEKKGYLKRASVESDARLKALFLTEQGLTIHKKIGNALHDTDKAMAKGFTEEEQEQLHSYIQRILKNLEEYEEKKV